MCVVLKCVCVYERVCECVGFLQQVDAAVVKQVGGALCSLLHHVVLVDHLHRLVVDAQPAVQPDVEDVRSVMAARGTVPMVIDDCGEGHTRGKKKKKVL